MARNPIICLIYGILVLKTVLAGVTEDPLAGLDRIPLNSLQDIPDYKSSPDYLKIYEQELQFRNNITENLSRDIFTSASTAYLEAALLVDSVASRVARKGVTFDKAYEQVLAIVIYTKLFPDTVKQVITEDLGKIVNATAWARNFVKKVCKDHMSFVPCNAKMAVVKLFLSKYKKDQLALLVTIGQLTEHHENLYKYLDQAMETGSAYKILVNRKAEFKPFILQLSDVFTQYDALKLDKLEFTLNDDPPLSFL